MNRAVSCKKQDEAANTIKFLRQVWEHRHEWLRSHDDAEKTAALWTSIAEDFKDGEGCQILKGAKEAKERMYRLCVKRRRETKSGSRTLERTATEEAKDAVISAWATFELLTSISTSISRLMECLTPAAMRMLASQVAIENARHGRGNATRDETHQEEVARLIFAPQFSKAIEQLVASVKTAPFGTRLEDMYADALELNDGEESEDDDSDMTDPEAIPSIEKEDGSSEEEDSDSSSSGVDDSKSAFREDSESLRPPLDKEKHRRIDSADLQDPSFFERLSSEDEKRWSMMESDFLRLKPKLPGTIGENAASAKRGNMEHGLLPTPPQSSNPACGSNSTSAEQGPEVEEGEDDFQDDSDEEDSDDVGTEIDAPSLLRVGRGHNPGLDSSPPETEDIRDLDFSEFLDEPDWGFPAGGKPSPIPQCQPSLRERNSRRRRKSRSRRDFRRRRNSTKFPSSSIPSSPRGPSPSLGARPPHQQTPTPPPPGEGSRRLRSESSLFIRQRQHTSGSPEPPRACASIQRTKRDRSFTPLVDIAKRENSVRKLPSRCTPSPAGPAQRRRSITGAGSAGGSVPEEGAQSQWAPAIPEGPADVGDEKEADNMRDKGKGKGTEKIPEMNKTDETEKGEKGKGKEMEMGKGAETEPASTGTQSREDLLPRIMDMEVTRPPLHTSVEALNNSSPLNTARMNGPAEASSSQKRGTPLSGGVRRGKAPSRPDKTQPVHIYFDENGREMGTELGRGVLRKAASCATMAPRISPAWPPPWPQAERGEQSRQTHGRPSPRLNQRQLDRYAQRPRSRSRHQSIANRRDSAMPPPPPQCADPNFASNKEQPEEPSPPSKRQKTRHSTASCPDPAMPSASGSPRVRREPTACPEGPKGDLSPREQRGRCRSSAEPPPPPFVSPPNCEPSFRRERAQFSVDRIASKELASTRTLPAYQPTSSAPTFAAALSPPPPPPPPQPKLTIAAATKEDFVKHKSPKKAPAKSRRFVRCSKSVPPPSRGNNETFRGTAMVPLAWVRQYGAKRPPPT